MNKAAVALGVAAAFGVGVASLSRVDSPADPGNDGRPRGIRNNNPLNIEFNPANNWQGQIGTDGRFAIFDTPFNGIRAAARLLRNYDMKYGLNTVRGIVSRWAPPVENNTTAYVSSVAKRTGLFPDLVLAAADYPPLVAAMIYHENGQQPYDMALINMAVNDGLS